MDVKFYPLILTILLLSSCHTEKAELEREELMGVWSGLLFQTEATYDSIFLQPVVRPEKAILLKNEKEKHLELTYENNYLSGKAEGGLRFDATYLPDSPTLYGVITNELWSQGLTFAKTNDKWVSAIQKPEIIDTDYTVYVEFYEDDSGKLQAKIQSNKENRKLHFEIDSVIISGQQIGFDITNDRFNISAEYNAHSNSILLAYGNAGGRREIQLTQLQPSALDGYKPLSEEVYTYQVPKPVDNLIPTASLQEVGIDTSMCDFMLKMNSGKYDHIHSLIITKDHKLVFEEYFHGYHRAYLHDIKSSFKSISSLLLGKAIMQDESIDINSPILDYYPEYPISDRRKRSITIHHALTMSTGLELEDEDEMQWNHNDWVEYKLNLPLKHEPGKTYEYSSGGMNLLTGVIQHSTEKYLPLFLYEAILLPMGIEKFQMRTSPTGRGYLAGDFYLRPIDFTKFGLLVLNKGVWDNQQLIDSDWMETSTQPYMKGSWPKDSHYGYLWRVLERKVGGKKMKTIEAWGNGGQFLIIIPEVEMTLTFTGGNYNLFPEMEEKPFDLLENYILPAVNLRNN